MKNLTKIIITVTFILLTLSFSACSGGRVSISFDENGSYLGFSDIPENYTAADAADDECLVIDIENEPNEYGVLVPARKDTQGYENWQTFLDKTEAGEEAFLRVAQFIDGTGYYHDLYFLEGVYKLFTWDEYGITDEGTYKYLCRLEGEIGPAHSSSSRTGCYYVLTDSMVLTYGDVSWSFLSSNLSTVTDIPFVWLGFMVYFE